MLPLKVTEILLIHILVFSCVILPVFSLKYPNRWVSFHFRCSTVFPYVDIAVTGFCNQTFVVLFSVILDSLITRIVASTQSSMLMIPPSPCHIYSSFRWKVLCIVVNFLVLWSMYLGSFSFHFKNGPEHHAMAIILVFIPLMRFLLKSLVSGSFLVFIYCFLTIIFFYQLLLWVFHTNVG